MDPSMGDYIDRRIYKYYMPPTVYQYGLGVVVEDAMLEAGQSTHCRLLQPVLDVHCVLRKVYVVQTSLWFVSFRLSYNQAPEHAVPSLKFRIGMPIVSSWVGHCKSESEGKFI